MDEKPRILAAGVWIAAVLLAVSALAIAFSFLTGVVFALIYAASAMSLRKGQPPYPSVECSIFPSGL